MHWDDVRVNLERKYKYNFEKEIKLWDKLMITP